MPWIGYAWYYILRNRFFLLIFGCTNYQHLPTTPSVGLLFTSQPIDKSVRFLICSPGTRVLSHHRHIRGVSDKTHGSIEGKTAGFPHIFCRWTMVDPFRMPVMSQSLGLCHPHRHELLCGCPARGGRKCWTFTGKQLMFLFLVFIDQLR